MLSKIVKEKNLSAINSLIKKHNKAVIVTHISPDGDALGSSLALCGYLENIGLEAKVVVPNKFPTFFNWMPGIDGVIIHEENEDYANQVLDEAELLFCLDFNTLKRVGAKMSQKIVDVKADKVLIDHHPDPDDFCQIIVSHISMSSTSELVFRLICALGDFDVLTPEIATCIYTGMMTDTGGFTYNSNDSEIYNIIGKLLTIGVNKDLIYRKVFNNYTVDRLRLKGYLLSEKLKVYEEYKTVMIHLTAEEQQRFNMQKGDTEGFANIPLSIAGIKFSIFFREEVDKSMIKISLRSVDDFPCNQFASRCFNGGGHYNASGAEFHGTLEEAFKIFEENLPNFTMYL